jgi:hypothetical protein
VRLSLFYSRVTGADPAGLALLRYGAACQPPALKGTNFYWRLWNTFLNIEHRTRNVELRRSTRKILLYHDLYARYKKDKTTAGDKEGSSVSEFFITLSTFCGSLFDYFAVRMLINLIQFHAASIRPLLAHHKRLWV